MKYVPWALLGLMMLYRRTWGACQCPDLQRRLSTAHRELDGYKAEYYQLIKHVEEYHRE